MGGAPDGGGTSACMTDLACMLGASGNQCGTCGAAGQPCCGTGNNGTCTTGLACTGRMSSMDMPGMCAACGAAGQPCCPTMGGNPDGGGTTACMADLGCVVAATGNLCGACGASGQACCGSGGNGTCMTGFGCSGRMASAGTPGMCAACGAAGQPCCSGGGATACMTGLTCSAMMCAVPDAGAADVPVGQ
jgi:hypothetical protein